MNASLIIFSYFIVLHDNPATEADSSVKKSCLFPMVNLL